MNDLLVPFILAFFPNWDENSIPINEDGTQCDYKSYIPLIFWCFDSMLKLTNHKNTLQYVTVMCKNHSININKIINKVSPIVKIWMKKNNLNDYSWLYSDFVLLFKRAFQNIWLIWFQFIISDFSNEFFDYFVASLILITFSQITTIPNINIPSIMDAFPRILETIDYHLLGIYGLYIYNNYKINLNLFENNNNKNYIYKFLEF